jgi:hypothetical protein
LNPAGNTQTINFYDLLSPSLEITPSSGVQSNGFILIDTDFEIESEEPLRNSGGSETISDEDLRSKITFAYQDGEQETIAYDVDITDQNTLITIDPISDMDEWRLVQVTFASGFLDTAGNVAGGATATFQTDDLTNPTIEEDSLDLANTAVFFTSSEGLYTDSTESGGLIVSDFEITNYDPNVNPNYDTLVYPAGTITINSLTRFSGIPLIGGETEIRINISTDNTASGSETFSIVPVEGQVFDQGGNQLIPTDNIQSFTLYDLLSPTVTFDPVAESLIEPTDTLWIKFDEPITRLDNSAVTNDNLDFIMQLAYTTQTPENIAFDASINSLKNVITIVPDDSLDEQHSLLLSFGDVFTDEMGNSISAMSANYTVRDITVPAFDSSTYAMDNTNILIFMTEGVYTDRVDEVGIGGLNTDDFLLAFQANGGQADSVIIESVTNTSGTVLNGGENAILVNLHVYGSPDGSETVTVNAANNTIFDHVGLVMNVTEITTSYNLTPAPVVLSSALSDDNTYLQLNFNENVFSTHDADEVVGIQDFVLEFNANDGNCTEMTINSISDTNNGTLNGGQDSIRVQFSISDIPSGVESFTLSPVDDEAIFNVTGVYMNPQTVLGPYTLYDLLIPTYSLNIGDGVEHISSDISLVVTFSEPVRNTDNSSLNNANTDDHFTLFDLTNSVEIAFNASINSEKTIITIAPADTFLSEHRIRLTMDNSFEDLAENAIPGDTVVIFTIRDYIAPAFSSVALADDNSYLDVYFTDEIFSSDSSTGIPVFEDFNLHFVSNGGNATQVNLAAIQTLAGNNLSGGEASMRFILEFDSNAGGGEYILLQPATASSLYDESGNVMAADASTDTLFLNDILVPTIDTLNIWQGDYLGINESTNIGLVFSEPIDSIDYSLNSRRDTSFSYEAIFTSDSLTLILNPPLMSLDTFDLVIASLIDTVGLSTVGISYRFLTPALGDYNTPPNDTINLEDLVTFIQAWGMDNFSKELGPVTGIFPHFKLYPDGKFGLDDGMVFTQMWRWSLQRFGIVEVSRQISGQPAQFSVNNQTITISPPLETRSGQIIVQYNVEECKVILQNPPSSNKGIFLSSADMVPGKLLLEYSYSDENVYPLQLQLAEKYTDQPSIDVRYTFMDKQANLIGQGDSTINFILIPESFTLHQNFPNPFNSATRIRYDLPLLSEVQIDIFDITGRLIKKLVDGDFQAGIYFVDWDGEDDWNEKVSSGIYFYQIRAGNFSQSIKMVLIK